MLYLWCICEFTQDDGPQQLISGVGVATVVDGKRWLEHDWTRRVELKLKFAGLIFLALSARKETACSG